MKRDCYAKINLALNVLDKQKPKGLHNLDMLNINIDLKDTVSIDFSNLGNDISITCNNKNVPTDCNNSVYKVIDKFKKIYKLNFSCNVSIDKNIPLEAGMAGGSANAACILNMLDDHFKTNMSVLQKIKFIEEITSDGAYMILSKPARVKGTGSIIEPINSKFKGKMLIVKPKFGLSTKDIYGSIDYKKICHPNINKLVEGLENNDVELISKHIGNSLLEPALKKNNMIEDLLNRLRVCGFEIVSMTGSGTTCFAYSKRKYPFLKAKEIINPDDYELVKICKILK